MKIGRKIPYDIPKMFRLIRESVRAYPRAMLFQLATDGFNSLEKRRGETPCVFEALLELPGIGPKCAGLIAGIACHEPRIGVDIHVHRVTNRWGYVKAATPEKTLARLIEKPPRKHWVEINELLVPFGKHICRGARPRCEICPVLSYCRQVGVVFSRSPRKPTPPLSTRI